MTCYNDSFENLVSITCLKHSSDHVPPPFNKLKVFSVTLRVEFQHMSVTFDAIYKSGSKPHLVCFPQHILHWKNKQTIDLAFPDTTNIMCPLNSFQNALQQHLCPLNLRQGYEVTPGEVIHAILFLPIVLNLHVYYDHLLSFIWKTFLKI